MKTALCKKIKNRNGISIIAFLLLILVIVAIVFVIAIPAYNSHLKAARLTFDAETVSTAHDVASVRYLQDGESGIITYYYDELSHKCLLRNEINTIKPYGRSFESENLNGETGAVGIPNLGKAGGAQLLAVTVESNSIRMRWTGKAWTYNDYLLMDKAEKNMLTSNDLHEMDRASVEKAVAAATAQYKAVYKKALRNNDNPGIAVYDYDIADNSVKYDSIQKKLDSDAAAIFADTADASAIVDNTDIAAYGLSDKADNTGAYIAGGIRSDEYLSCMPQMELSSEDNGNIGVPKGCIVQVWIMYDTQADRIVTRSLWKAGSAGRI